MCSWVPTFLDRVDNSYSYGLIVSLPHTLQMLKGMHDHSLMPHHFYDSPSQLHDHRFEPLLFLNAHFCRLMTFDTAGHKRDQFGIRNSAGQN